MENGPDELADAARSILREQANEALQTALTTWLQTGAGEAANDLGTAFVKLGRKDLAERAYERALSLAPGLYKPHNNLGNLLLERGEAARAVEHLERAAEIAPERAPVWLNLGNAIVAAGLDPTRAVEAYERSVAISPTWKALHNLGAIHAKMGEPAAAVTAFERALEIDGAALGTSISLAEVLTASGRRTEAEARYRAVAKLLPREPVIVANFLASLEVSFHDEVGMEVAEQALDAWPHDETILLMYVFLLERNGVLERGEKRFAAMAEQCTVPAPLLHLARLRARQFHYDQEAALISEAERRFPGHPAVLAQKARLLRHELKLDEAIATLEQLAAAPDCSTDALETLGATFLDVGDARAAFDVLRRAEAAVTNKKLFSRSMLAFVSNAVDGLTPEEVAEIHRGFPTARQAALPQMELAPRSLDPERRLRVGYVSPDFRAHAVGMFMEPVLVAHDRSQVEIFCYSTTTLRLDETSARIQSLDLTWRDVKNISDFALAEKIVADGIDILVDLAGWTSEQRMNVFQMRAAPIRVTYLGYPNTTGLAEMQYRLTDEWADPPGTERHFVEELVRLPRCAWAFDLVEAPPPVLPRPRDLPIVFGSFNNLQKTTATTLDLWAEILGRVPGSRLLLKSKQLTYRRAHERILGELSKRGVDPARVELRARTTSRYEHLEMYGDLDIGLDPFPYNGTTTTCEALTMGVPVVSLRGTTPASRVGYSLLRAIGMPELATDDPAVYVETAVGLATDRARLRNLRKTLRSRLTTSELGDTAALTRAMEAAYRSIWRAFVETHPRG
ncbi:MAG: tetratricopeptide repeat protein [Myxococcales bacterium]|nr:tetratricopeptide repeat protein [Myxococcales bacterium]